MIPGECDVTGDVVSQVLLQLKIEVKLHICETLFYNSDLRLDLEFDRN